MAKDRAAPFSKKHRRYWIPVLGGMLIIGGINLALGFCVWPGSDVAYRKTEKIELTLPQVPKYGTAPDAAPAPATAPDASPR